VKSSKEKRCERYEARDTKREIRSERYEARDTKRDKKGETSNQFLRLETHLKVPCSQRVASVGDTKQKIFALVASWLSPKPN
jgi:hypothetical protein